MTHILACGCQASSETGPLPFHIAVKYTYFPVPNSDASAVGIYIKLNCVYSILAL